MTNFNPQLSDSDLELLSAYLDQQLGAAERGVLEQRIEREPALRGALDDMRATVALLRDLPPARPPRSFTLDPQTVAPRRGWSFPWAQFGSAFVAVALLLVFGFALTRSYRSPSSTAGAPAAAQQDAAAATAAPAAEAPMMAAAEPTAEAAMPAAGAALAAPTAASAADAQSAESSAAEPTQPELALDATSLPAARQAETPATANQPEPANPAGDTAGGSAAETAAPAGTPVFSASQAATAVSSPPIAAPEPAPAAEPSAPASGVGWGWVAFGSLALLVALGAWWATRRRK